MTKIFIKTYGCSANHADSESIANIVVEAGYELCNKVSDADLIIVNTCTVKTPTENKTMNYLSKLKKPVIVCGCIPQADPILINTKLRNFSIVGVFDIINFKKAIEETLRGNRVVYTKSDASKKVCLKKQRKNKVVAIIPISEGCLGNCAYCLTKKARGNLFSFSEEKIIEEAKEAVKSGYKELWITSQDNSAYGLDRNTNIAKLLEKLVEIQGDFFIRVGMMNPDHVIKFLPDLIKVYKNPKIFKFLHIPVQSGNNNVLKSMNRFYTIEEFKHIVFEFRNAIPDITISTDMICGFPGETKEQFKDSLDLIRWLRPGVLNISRFWERPNTKATELNNKIDGRETNARSREMNLVFEEVVEDVHKDWINWQGSAIVDEKGMVPKSVVVRNYAYKPIIIRKDLEIGSIVNVKIIENKVKYLIGTLI